MNVLEQEGGLPKGQRLPVRLLPRFAYNPHKLWCRRSTFISQERVMHRWIFSLWPLFESWTCSFQCQILITQSGM